MAKAKVRFLKSLVTDYPIIEFGDQVGKAASQRRCKIVCYDGNKYAKVEVVDEIKGIVIKEIKLGYIYLK